jgi:hypothetical protein
LSRQLNKSNRDNTVDKVEDFFIIAGMAKQAGILKIIGTVNNICFYKLESLKANHNYLQIHYLLYML